MGTNDRHVSADCQRQWPSCVNLKEEFFLIVDWRAHNEGRDTGSMASARHTFTSWAVCTEQQPFFSAAASSQQGEAEAGTGRDDPSHGVYLGLLE